MTPTPDGGTTDNPSCPRCGDTSLAVHDNRRHCGQCGYTEWQ